VPTCRRLGPADTDASSGYSIRRPEILVYSAEPGSPSRDRLDLLASWAATPAEPRSS
jgi:hypothetical protein